MWIKTSGGDLVNLKAMCCFRIAPADDCLRPFWRLIGHAHEHAISLEYHPSKEKAQQRLDEIEKMLQEPECVFFVEEKK